MPNEKYLGTVWKDCSSCELPMPVSQHEADGDFFVCAECDLKYNGDHYDEVLGG